MLINKHFLPIGSVVGVKDDSRRLLIISRQIYSETNHVVRDYAALEYPGGFINAEEMFVLFDRKDIENVYHYGYVDEVELKLDQMLYETERNGRKDGDHR